MRHPTRPARPLRLGLAAAALLIAGCASHARPPATPLARETAMLDRSPAGPKAGPDTDAAQEAKPAWVWKDAPLPAGFPAPGPTGEAILKRYPARRAAVARAGGEGDLFRTLFNHIKSRDIAMTAPVELAMQEGGDAAGTTRGMAFFYPSPDLGRTGGDGPVEVIDLPAELVVSVGLRGAYNARNFAKGLALLRGWLEGHADAYAAAGPPRYMGYNSPMVPWFLRFGEAQVPVKKLPTR